MVLSQIDMRRTGAKIKKLCKEKNISVKDIQKELRIGAFQSVYDWFSGKSLPSLDNFFYLSKLLKVHMEDMIVLIPDTVVINICFEDDVWENAGYNREKNYVWSNKIGWSQFHDAVVAAYTLEEQYTEGVAATMVNGEFVTSWRYVGWLNYLFDEKNHIKNFDKWSLFEAYHHAGDIERYGEQERMWSELGSKRYAFISACEICAVLCGIEEMMKKIEEIEKEEIENLAFESMKIAIDILRTYEKSEQYTAEEKCQGIMDTVKRYYAGEVEEECEYKALVRCLKVADAPAVLVKGIAEIFGKKFWELWD